MSDLFTSFTKCYKPEVKTLRFSLIPQGKTQEQIEKTGILKQDESRAESYRIVKEIFDDEHRNFIESTLNNVTLNWEPLFNTHKQYRQTKNETELEKQRKIYIDKVSKLLTDGVKKIDLSPKKIIERIIKETTLDSNDKRRNAILNFQKFSTYFKGYDETRQNIYDKKESSVAFRVVVDNFTKFFNNCYKYYNLSPEFKECLNLRMKGILGNISLDDIFTVNYFNKTLTQSGIDNYNKFIGNNSVEVSLKTRGLNELCNEAYNQKQLPKKIVFDFLYDQILSNKQTLSFIDETYQTDKDLLQSLKSYLTELSVFMEENNEIFAKAFIDSFIDTAQIYVSHSKLTKLSSIVCNDWSLLESRFKKKQKQYSIHSLQEKYPEKCIMETLYEKYRIQVDLFKTAYIKLQPILDKDNIASYDLIKECLDSIIALENLLKIFIANNDDEKNEIFYQAHESIYNKLREVIPIYNRIRNYATKKEYVEEKYKINFDTVTLGDGWDENKELDNNCILLLKDNKYYLGIFNKNIERKERKLKESTTSTNDSYRKMVCKKLSNINGNLPRVFLPQKKLENSKNVTDTTITFEIEGKHGTANITVEKEIISGYNAKKHIKGDTFNIEFCHKLIDYFKKCIMLHPDWSLFGFKFSDTSTYENIGQFYNEISQQSYQLSFRYVTEQDVNQAIDSGKLFLFQIYNKDFSEKSTGKKNLHTLYWQQIFSDNNIKTPVLQLNGSAELFYRKKSIDNPFIHKQGSVLIRKTMENNTYVDEEIYRNALIDSNTLSIEELKEKYPNLMFREAPHDIIKDKRFTSAQYKFHCPISINYDVSDDIKAIDFNKAVTKTLLANNDFNIMGIDRGERNLLYISIIDQNGNIKLQKSLNKINGVDYHDKLEIIAKNRDMQRKNWEAIENIKDLKEGYLSAAVNEICNLMIDNNAIIVMEKLHEGFKNTRAHIEYKTYQNFEIALLKKLNYLAFKNKLPNDIGGISNAYQLSAKYKTISEIGTQSGFVFYVPASYTSKIDPLTGFVNLFNAEHLKYKSIEKTQQFFNKFDSVIYDEKLGFKFKFTYSGIGINEGGNTKWTICTGVGSRVIYKPDRLTGKGCYEEINVTDELKKLFECMDINYDNDLKQVIIQQSSKYFYEKLLWLFGITVRLRYSNKNEDYILSPIEKDGMLFDSRVASLNFPCDGDANGAYHIALKGLRLVKEQINSDGSIRFDEKGKSNKNWFEFAQKIAKSKIWKIQLQ